MSTYVIGDVHGCLDSLHNLLKKIKFQPKKDTLWFTGDLVNRGSQSLEVLRFVSKLPQAVCVLGNHDLYCLALWAGFAPENKHAFEGLKNVLNAPDADKLMDWLRNCPLMHLDEQHVLVHAGIPPQWTLEQTKQHTDQICQILRGDNAKDLLQHMAGNYPTQWQENLTPPDRWRYIINALTRMRFCKANGELDMKTKGAPSQAPSGFQPWYAHPKHKVLGTFKEKNKLLLYGHWAAANGIRDHPQVVALDTGCVWGNALTSMRLEDRKMFQVPGL